MKSNETLLPSKNPKFPTGEQFSLGGRKPEIKARQSKLKMNRPLLVIAKGTDNVVGT